QKEDRLPAPGSRQGVEHRPLEGGAASSPRQGDGRGRRVYAQHGDAPSSEGVEHPAGAAANVEHGSRQGAQELPLGGGRRSVPTIRVELQRTSAIVMEDEARGAHDANASDDRSHRLHAAAVRVYGCCAATRARSEAVSISRRVWTTRGAKPSI